LLPNLSIFWTAQIICKNKIPSYSFLIQAKAHGLFLAELSILSISVLKYANPKSKLVKHDDMYRLFIKFLQFLLE